MSEYSDLNRHRQPNTTDIPYLPQLTLTLFKPVLEANQTHITSAGSDVRCELRLGADRYRVRA